MKAINSEDITPVTKGDELLENVLDDKPEEHGSTAEDFGYDKDEDYEAPEYEDVEGACPDCGSPKVTRCARAAGPDDFMWEYVCKSCGSTWNS